MKDTNNLIVDNNMSVRTPEKDKNDLTKDYTLTIARSIEEINSLRTIWDEFQLRPNSDIDHFLHVTTHDKTIIRPHATLLERAGKPVAIAAGRVEQSRFSCKFGYKNIYAPLTKVLGIPDDGLLGDFSIENGRIILNSLVQTMRLENLDLIRFSYLRIESPMYELVKKHSSILMRDHLKYPSKHWRMDVPENIEGFYKARSSKHRYWLRRIRRILEAEFPGQVHYKVYADGPSLDELIVNAETVARKTYQWGLGQGFRDSPEMRKRLRAFVKKNQLRAHILYIRNDPFAFWLGRSYRNTFYLMQTGYDPEYKRYELGTILFIYMLQDLAENTKMDYIDFGFSEQPYKVRFGNECWEEETVHLFAANSRGLRLNIIRTVIGVSWAYTIGMVNKLGIKNKLKRLMRDRLIKRLK
ncbi:MAG: GNAT family N-acetyltransferase [Syntrophaceae bacterium]|nr:GNAT family N-acetyltransferase [Syntrophaceae bacterium]